MNVLRPPAGIILARIFPVLNSLRAVSNGQLPSVRWRRQGDTFVRAKEGGAMRRALILASLGMIASALLAQAPDPAWRLETQGQYAEAHTMLQRAASGGNATAAEVRAYAEFLDRYRDPAARQQYARLADMLDRAKAPAPERAAANRR